MISEFPLTVFAILTGVAAGGYVAAALFPKKDEGAKPWLFPLVALILIAVGGLTAMEHMDRPGNILDVSSSPIASLTLEGMLSGVLAVVSIVDLAIDFSKKQTNRVVLAVGTMTGLVLRSLRGQHHLIEIDRRLCRLVGKARISFPYARHRAFRQHILYNSGKLTIERDGESACTKTVQSSHKNRSITSWSAWTVEKRSLLARTSTGL